MNRPSLPFDGLIPDYPSDTLDERTAWNPEALDVWRFWKSKPGGGTSAVSLVTAHFEEYRRLVREDIRPTQDGGTENGHD